tara:strand:- start:3352 stop:4320 length:969 start_codon:yes stop_codon:yes gene_type:complete
MITIPENLTKNAEKRRLFGGDPYYRDAWDDICELWPEESERAGVLHDTALVIFRPDAIVSRRLEIAMRTFSDHGMVPVASTLFRYDRMKVREGWRYQLNIATRDRIDVMDMVLAQTPSILVLWRHNGPFSQVPASVRLSSLKGPSLPAKREPGNLRYQMGRAQVSVLTFIHISDEPADVIRELGVFMAGKARREMLRQVRSGHDVQGEVDRLIHKVYDRYPPHDILMVDTIKKIRASLSGRNEAEARDHSILRQLTDIQFSKNKDWRKLLATCQRQGVVLDAWERIAVAAELSSRHFDDLKPILPDIGRSIWESTEREQAYE